MHGAPQAPWTPERLAVEVVTPEAAPTAVIEAKAKAKGLPIAEAKRLIAMAEHAGLIHRHRLGSGRTGYATIAQIKAKPPRRKARTKSAPLREATA